MRFYEFRCPEKHPDGDNVIPIIRYTLMEGELHLIGLCRKHGPISIPVNALEALAREANLIPAPKESQ